MILSLKNMLSPQLTELLASIGAEAFARKARAYLVGGIVRDILLGIEPNTADIDIMFDNDSGGIARHFKDNWVALFPDIPEPRKLIVFSRYGTAKLVFREPICGGVEVIDFSTARRELYPAPGARPEVSPGDLLSDMARRDFSINAMAVSLMPESIGELSDFFAGQNDLQNRELNVLHDRSFIDDPARLLRGARFKVRFNFRFGENTARLASEGIAGNYLSLLAPVRLFEELKKVLLEEDVAKVLTELEKTGLLYQVNPVLRLNPGVLKRIEGHSEKAKKERGKGNSKPLWLRILAELVSVNTEEEVRAMVNGFSLHAQLAEELLELYREHRGSGKQ